MSFYGMFDREKEAKAARKKGPPKEEDDAEKLKNQGNEQYKEKNFEKALELYDQAIALRPEILFYNNKAAVYLEQEDIQNAEKAVDKAIEIIKEEKITETVKIAKVYARKAHILHKTSTTDFKEALKYFKLSVSNDLVAKVNNELKEVQKKQETLDQEQARVINKEAKQLFRKFKFKEAQKEYIKSSKLDPYNHKYHYRIGLCWIGQSDHKKALEKFDKAIDCNPNYLKQYIKKAFSHMSLEEYENALEAYENGNCLDKYDEQCIKGMKLAKNAMYSGGTGLKESEKGTMKDPEVKNIFYDPKVQEAMQKIKSDPSGSVSILKDPYVAPRLLKLQEWGILTMSGTSTDGHVENVLNSGEYVDPKDFSSQGYAYEQQKKKEQKEKEEKEQKQKQQDQGMNEEKPKQTGEQSKDANNEKLDWGDNDNEEGFNW